MFSALKRLTGNKIEAGVSPTSPGLQTMSQNLQKKFSKGIQYNMKIIIKGDRNTGKTCLFHRLQGQKFVQEYIPTEEIQVASIQWNYKMSEEVVKVEVWDVVDKGKKRPPLDGLKLSQEVSLALDAEFIDVYKGTNGVILVMDITKSWTFEYVQKELAKVPDHIPVLILGNHCDMSHHRTITKEAVSYYIESVQRRDSWAQIRYTESSMSNGFGLKYLHKFFCLPFLQLQRTTLLAQLERNSAETSITVQELDFYQQGPDADYDKFLDNLSKRRREVADSVGVPSSMSVGNLQSVQQQPGEQPTLNHSVSAYSLPQCPPPRPIPQLQPPTAAPSPPQPSQQTSPHQPPTPSKNETVKSVEEFIPEGGVFLDKSFLDDATLNAPPSVLTPDDSDSDENDTGNPLVAGFQDDLDPDDVALQSKIIPQTFVNMNAQMEDWGGRESPEGGEDIPQADTVDKGEKPMKSKSKGKKKSNKEKLDAGTKEEKKRKKKVSKTSMKSELEEFLGSHDSSYEAI